MNSKTLREKFLKYFESKGHKVIPSASLVPENDPTVLFNVAGMQPLVPYLLGEKHSEGQKLVDVQKCIRTIDIDEVGDKTHNTFFEMLGYWSLGVYWKKEAIQYIFEFLTEELGINIKKLAVTCFRGDEKNGITKDNESADIWRSLGIAEERIVFLGHEDNWWGPAGTTGPCGPDTEIFFWTGEDEASVKFEPNDKNWVEIGNDVFMAFNKNNEGKFSELSQRNVDFGAGFERTLMTLNGFDEIYLTDLFQPLIHEIEKISCKKYGDNTSEFRIMADHLRAAVFMINDGVTPSNKDRGYVLRRLVRRAIVKGYQIGIAQNFTTKIAEKVFEVYDGVYSFDRGIINSELEKEESKFRKTLKEGLKIIESKKDLSGEDLFNLYQSFGIPLEISLEEAKRLEIPLIDKAVELFDEMKRKHQELSRTASAGMFKGGLADAGEETKRLHTAAHLMLAALRRVLGDHVYQKGSNITSERLRFDFSHPDKMTPEQITEVEDIVNEAIRQDLPVEMEEMSIDEAKHRGAMGVFDSKYGEKVKVYSISSSTSTESGETASRSVKATGDTAGGELLSRPSTGSGFQEFFSSEICGGPHANRTGELGHFRIVKEESSSSGVRRIKAILE